mmetsp:Transcript_8637/g.15613  ORF Transcript_8637/g.15613 Transcript_8637/m.15613 type:complete len:123 (-) Transcript_8637:581-949(-)
MMSSQLSVHWENDMPNMELFLNNLMRWANVYWKLSRTHWVSLRQGILSKDGRMCMESCQRSQRNHVLKKSNCQTPPARNARILHRTALLEHFGDFVLFVFVGLSLFESNLRGEFKWFSYFKI